MFRKGATLRGMRGLLPALGGPLRMKSMRSELPWLVAVALRACIVRDVRACAGRGGMGGVRPVAPRERDPPALALCSPLAPGDADRETTREAAALAVALAPLMCAARSECSELTEMFDRTG